MRWFVTPNSSLAGGRDWPLDPFRDRVATNYLFCPLAPPSRLFQLDLSRKVTRFLCRVSLISHHCFLLFPPCSPQQQRRNCFIHLFYAFGPMSVATGTTHRLLWPVDHSGLCSIPQLPLQDTLRETTQSQRGGTILLLAS